AVSTSPHRATKARAFRRRGPRGHGPEARATASETLAGRRLPALRASGVRITLTPVAPIWAASPGRAMSPSFLQYEAQSLWSLVFPRPFSRDLAKPLTQIGALWSQVDGLLVLLGCFLLLTEFQVNFTQ